MIYLDYAAQTPCCKEVLDVFNEITLNYIANPNAAHALGKKAQQRIEESTMQIAQLLGVKPTEIIYTSGATEANNLAIKGIVNQYKRNGKHIITTYLEHSSVTNPIASLQREGYEIEFVDIQSNGQVDLEHLKQLLRVDTVLVSIASIDSELGVVQPIEAITAMLKAYPKCFFHVDATQSIGKEQIDLTDVDLITLAPHKFYGLNGCGILVKKEHIMLEPLFHGGVSTTTFRSGTPALPLIAATEVALRRVLHNQEEAYKHVARCNAKLKEGLEKYQDILFNSTDKSNPYILNVSLRGKNANAMQQALAEEEVYVATKSACCTLNTPSRPVYALTKDRKRALATLRISLSHLTTEEEIDTFLKIFDRCYQALSN